MRRCFRLSCRDIRKWPNLLYLQVLGKVEDERAFSVMSFLKSKLRNHQLTVVHIDLVVRMFAHDFYTNKRTFPNQQAITDWKAHEVCYGGGELKQQGTTTNLRTVEMHVATKISYLVFGYTGDMTTTLKYTN